MKHLALISTLLTMAACYTPYTPRPMVPPGPPVFQVVVDALCEGDVQPGSYVLASGVDGVDSNSLQFREYAAYVHRVLGEHGYSHEPDAELPQYLVLLGYAVSEPNAQTSYVSFGGGGTFMANSFGRTMTGFSSMGPSFAVPVTRTMYGRMVMLAAYSTAEGTAREVWRVTASSIGASGDLRVVMPAMLAVARDYVARSPGQQVAASIAADDPRIGHIRGETVAPPPN